MPLFLLLVSSRSRDICSGFKIRTQLEKGAGYMRLFSHELCEKVLSISFSEFLSHMYSAPPNVDGVTGII